jgi:hypothetical protein
MRIRLKIQEMLRTVTLAGLLMRLHDGSSPTFRSLSKLYAGLGG